MRFLQIALSRQIIFACQIILAGCVPCRTDFTPCVTYCPRQDMVRARPSPFSPLQEKELQEAWAREWVIGKGFAKEGDYYRAITSYKRALFLLPCQHPRRVEIEFFIMEAYFLNGKCQEVVELFESGDIKDVEAGFVASDDLLIMVAECYHRLEECEKRDFILKLLEIRNPEKALSLSLGELLSAGKLGEASCLLEEHPCRDQLASFQFDYLQLQKSPAKAGFLNAILPGAGYLYVGQPNTALTSFLLNSLFIAAAYQCFDRGLVPAGVILTSLEAGWWLGGINGARLAAKEYNEKVYTDLGRSSLADCQLFPVLLLEWGF